MVAPVFDAAIGAHWETHLERMVEFWCTMMLDTRSFSGSVFGTHMQLKGVEPVHFERWMSLWYRHTAVGFDAADREQLREKQQYLLSFTCSLFFHREGHLDLGAGLEKLLVDRHIDSLSLTAKKVALLIFISPYDKDVDSNRQAGRAK